MKLSKTQKRVNWINSHLEEIETARTNDHDRCRGECGNGATCHNQSGGGWGWWANALDLAGVPSEHMPFWSGSNPTPSTSINRGLAGYISKNSPEELR